MPIAKTINNQPFTLLFFNHSFQKLEFISKSEKIRIHFNHVLRQIFKGKALFFAKNPELMTLTKTIDIKCSADQLFNFISNLSNWPKFAIHNILAISKGEDEYRIIETPRGEGKLKMSAVKDLGIIDHEFIDASEGKWTVPARIVPTPTGCHLMMTFTKPELLPKDIFEQGMLLVDEELAQLRNIMESA